MATRASVRPKSKQVPPRSLASRAGHLHRVARVRERQGVSLRSAARQMGVEIRELRRQERESTDLSLSDLYRWQQVLGVPVSELLEEDGSPLSCPIKERANLVRIMKTVKTLQEKASRGGGGQEQSAICNLTETLVGQLLELMPELADVTSWHSVGKRRSLDEFGKAAQRMISEDMFLRSPDWGF